MKTQQVGQPTGELETVALSMMVPRRLKEGLEILAHDANLDVTHYTVPILEEEVDSRLEKLSKTLEQSVKSRKERIAEILGRNKK